jgi:four helix bundle protein
MKNFKQLKIWQKGFEIATKMYELITHFPKDERFGLSSQLTRAAISIPSNIAEGSSRSSENDYCLYKASKKLMAHGSQLVASNL